MHLSAVIIPLGYMYYFNLKSDAMILILLILLFIAFLVELLRLNHSYSSQTFHRFLGHYLRNHEHTFLTGATYLLISCLLSILILPGEMAYLTMMFLIVGDASATIIGILHGKRFWKGSRKSLEGSLAIFIVSFSIALFYSNFLIFALIGALMATLAELSTIPINDNLKIPLFSGLGMYLVMYIF